ncbi:MAG: heat-inducible transcriptional repressor HrcA [Gammaproteobacteria bacterium]|nr:heat-inducible transcriptional repressor HrcA [Gammaproteobacteria bacterium]
MQILEQIVERYIHDGQPVASKTLSQESKIMLSSASIRSIMADLETAGYLASPHTSAGRVPTDLGYRLFVDNLLTVQQTTNETLDTVKKQLSTHHDDDARQLLKNASSLLSGITHLVGMVTVPKCDKMILRHLEFLPLSDNRILIILVVNTHEVQNRVIQTERAYTKKELQRFGEMISNRFAGVDLLKIKSTLLQELREDQQDLKRMLSAVMQVVEKRVDEVDPVMMAGENHLFDHIAEDNNRQLRELFALFEDKCAIVQLLDRCLNVDGVQIFIGEESGHDVFQACSVVTAPYDVDGEVVGVLGVIGPRRMRYRQVISTVDATATLLSQVFSKSRNTEH